MGLQVAGLLAEGYELAGDTLEFAVNSSGVYRVEGWLDVAGERRPWVYSNPIYVR